MSDSVGGHVGISPLQGGGDDARVAGGVENDEPAVLSLSESLPKSSQKCPAHGWYLADRVGPLSNYGSIGKYTLIFRPAYQRCIGAEDEGPASEPTLQISLV